MSINIIWLFTSLPNKSIISLHMNTCLWLFLVVQALFTKLTQLIEVNLFFISLMIFKIFLCISNPVYL